MDQSGIVIATDRRYLVNTDGTLNLLLLYEEFKKEYDCELLMDEQNPRLHIENFGGVTVEINFVGELSLNYKVQPLTFLEFLTLFRDLDFERLL